METKTAKQSSVAELQTHTLPNGKTIYFNSRDAIEIIGTMQNQADSLAFITDAHQKALKLHDEAWSMYQEMRERWAKTDELYQRSSQSWKELDAENAELRTRVYIAQPNMEHIYEAIMNFTDRIQIENTATVLDSFFFTYIMDDEFSMNDWEHKDMHIAHYRDLRKLMVNLAKIVSE